MTGEMRMKWSRSPGAHDLRPIVRSRASSPGSVTALDGPTAVTLQPDWPAGSSWSASNATTAPRVAAASLPLPSVLITMSPSSRTKLTSSTAGSARRV